MKVSIEIELYECRQPTRRTRRYPTMTSYGLVDVLNNDATGLPIGVMEVPNPRTRIEISQSDSGIVYVQYGIGKNETWFSTKRSRK